MPADPRLIRLLADLDAIGHNLAARAADLEAIIGGGDVPPPGDGAFPTLGWISRGLFDITPQRIVMGARSQAVIRLPAPTRLAHARFSLVLPPEWLGGDAAGLHLCGFAGHAMFAAPHDGSVEREQVRIDLSRPRPHGIDVVGIMRHLGNPTDSRHAFARAQLLEPAVVHHFDLTCEVMLTAVRTTLSIDGGLPFSTTSPGNAADALFSYFYLGNMDVVTSSMDILALEFV